MHCNTLPRRIFTFAVCTLCFALSIPAFSAQVANRITRAVSSTSYAQLPNTVNPRTRLAADLGPASPNTKLVGMSVRFTRTAAQEAALDQLLSDQQNPSSPNYRQWLTPAQFGAQFGLSSDDIDKVTAWLTSQGFTVTGVANGGSFVTFTGTVAQVQTAFATSIHNLSLDGESHFANVSNISVPAALGDVIADVTGLHNFRLKPHVNTSVAHPEFTSSITGSHFIAPGDLYTIYNVKPLLNATTPINGTGETIAVTGQVDIFSADVTAFRSAAGLTANLPTTVHEGGDPGNALCNTNCSPNQGDLAESTIDVEWSGAMAPSANILFVNGPDVLFNAMTQAVDQNLAPIITTSYGACEAAWGSAELLTLNGLFKQANAQGQTILAAAGDAGATDCDAGSSAIEGLAVDFPGSSPYVTSMGGTMFNDGIATTGSGTSWAATQYWAGTAGSDVLSSALSYIPELPWNDEPNGYFGGGGGGASAFFSKPAWQVGTPADASRDVPDISLNASDTHDQFLYCVNVALGTSCTSGFRIANSNLETAGGTSFDSQIFGGLLALVEQKIGARVGNANQTLYALANNSTYFTPGGNFSTNANLVFNDVTSGNNSMVCTAGSPNCLNGGTAGFSAANGYDLASGWGSVNVANLAADWTKVTPLGVGSLGTNTSTTSLIIPPNCPTSGASCLTTVSSGATLSLAATVAGSVGTPTGTVQFFANNVALGSPVALPTSGPATYSWVTSCSNFGQNVMSASYSGDANYQGSKGPTLTVNGSSVTSNGSSVTSPIEVQVTGSSCPDFSLAVTGGTGVTISGTNGTTTVAAGGTIPAVTITATPSNSFNGTVVFSVAETNTSGYPPVFTFSPASLTLSGSTAATTSLTLTGITANLRLPGAPGKVDSVPMFAQQSPTQAPGAGRTWYVAGSGVTAASLLLLTLPRRRRLGGLLLAALAVALAAGVSGCGGSSLSAPPTTTTTTSSNPYVGTYTVTVVGTYTNAATGQVNVHSTKVTYTIN